jgi:hypothetical protein
LTDTARPSAIFPILFTRGGEIKPAVEKLAKQFRESVTLKVAIEIVRVRTKGEPALTHL